MDPKEVYSVLLDQVKKNPYNYIIDKTICFYINSLEGIYAEVLTSLIFHHYILDNKPNQKITELDLVKSANKKSNMLTIPYGGKTYDTGKGPRFDNLNKIPSILKQIIVAYIKCIS